MSADGGAQQVPMVASISRLMDQRRVDAYARAARDPNPLHTDAVSAAEAGFERPVVHGMLLLALVSEAMTATHGERWARSGTLKVRWRAPAMQPALVAAFLDPRSVDDGVASYDVRCELDDGTLLLAGTASVALE